MKSKQSKEQPASVPEAKQAGEIRDRWSWSESAVWTERMLTALEEGVKGGKWYSLIDKICRQETLKASFVRVKANRGSAGVDYQTPGMFEIGLEEKLARLSRSVRQGCYRPKKIRRVWIPKPGSREKRPLGIPTVEDRVVQGALRLVLEPIFERDFSDHSYGFRPRRGCKDALREVDSLLKQGCRVVVDADIKSFFDSIPHRGLLDRVASKVSDGRVLDLIESYLVQGIMDGMSEWTPEEGTPQGAVISPLLANIYLDPLDHLIKGAGGRMVRYADDFVIFCRSREEAEEMLSLVDAWMSQAGLRLHPDKTVIVDMAEPGGFDFLGYHFEGGRRWPREKSLKKFKDSVRGKTRRANGDSLEAIITNLNHSTKGWYEYFKHSSKWVFPRLDGWIRMRLRSILRKRQGKKGRGRGSDHQRWPNAYFASSGLFSMATAHRAACQSVRR